MSGRLVSFVEYGEWFGLQAPYFLVTEYERRLSPSIWLVESLWIPACWTCGD